MAMRRAAGLLGAVMLASLPALAREGPGRHYSAVSEPDRALLRAGAALGVSVGIEVEDAAVLRALYRHRHAVSVLLRDALGGRVGAGGVARRGVVVLVGAGVAGLARALQAAGVGAAEAERIAQAAGAIAGRPALLALAEGPVLALAPAMDEPAGTSPARILLRALPAPPP